MHNIDAFFFFNVRLHSHLHCKPYRCFELLYCNTVVVNIVAFLEGLSVATLIAFYVRLTATSNEIPEYSFVSRKMMTLYILHEFVYL